MKRVKEFLENFISAEAEMKFRYRYPDLVLYNSSVKEVQSFIVEELKGSMNDVELSSPRSERSYSRSQLATKPLRRYLFKISQYTHKLHGDVWVGFCSLANPSSGAAILNRAFFVICIDNNLKIAQTYAYTDFSSDGLKYAWEQGQGLDDLTFNSLDGPIEILRIMEPNNSFDGLRLYNDDI